MKPTRVAFSRYASLTGIFLKLIILGSWAMVSWQGHLKSTHLGGTGICVFPCISVYSCWVAEFQDRVDGCAPWISCPNFQMCASVHNYLRKQEFEALVFSGGREEALSFLYYPIGSLQFSVSKSVMVSCNFCASSQRALGSGATTNLSEDQFVLIIYRVKTLRGILFSIGPIIGVLRNCRSLDIPCIRGVDI